MYMDKTPFRKNYYEVWSLPKRGETGNEWYWLRCKLSLWCLFRFWNQCEGGRASSQKWRKKRTWGTDFIEVCMLMANVTRRILTENSDGFRKVYSSIKNGQLVDRDDVQIVLQKEVDDLSPLLKTSGYCVSRKGYSNFPKVSKCIMRSHFFIFQMIWKSLRAITCEIETWHFVLNQKKYFVKTIETTKWSNTPVQSQKKSSSWWAAFFLFILAKFLLRFHQLAYLFRFGLNCFRIEDSLILQYTWFFYCFIVFQRHCFVVFS